MKTKEQIINGLRAHSTETSSNWREEVMGRLSNQETRRKARKVALAMLNAMKQKNISEMTLSSLLGISSAELSSILKGHKLPSACTSQAIESALNISLS